MINNTHKDERPSFYAKSRKEWRPWLLKNSKREKNIWLIIYKKESETASIYYDEAVEEALCFGWIDNKANKRNAESFYLYFAQRNPKSRWSKLNKQRVEELVQKGAMTPAGLAMVEEAKSSGTWFALDDVEALVLPADLEKH